MAAIVGSMICNRLLGFIILVLVVTDEVYTVAFDGLTVFIVVALPCHNSSSGGVSDEHFMLMLLPMTMAFTITLPLDMILEPTTVSFGCQ